MGSLFLIFGKNNHFKLVILNINKNNLFGGLTTSN